MGIHDQAENLRKQVADTWTEEKNARRAALIDKEIDWDLSPSEQRELAHLQEQMLAHRNKVAPLPITEAKALHDKLKAQLADASTEDAEDDETYVALKVSFGRITRGALDLLDMTYSGASTIAIQRQTMSHAGDCRDTCGFHGIEIPEDSE